MCIIYIYIHAKVYTYTYAHNYNPEGSWLRCEMLHERSRKGPSKKKNLRKQKKNKKVKKIDVTAASTGMITYRNVRKKTRQKRPVTSSIPTYVYARTSAGLFS